MHFYTNVSEYKGKLLVSGYLNGKRYREIEKYKPFLFIRGNEDSRYRTINGKPAERVDFESIWDAKQFIKRYEDVEGFDVFGLDKFNYVYINETFPNIQYDTNLIKLATLDIEVATDTGFPDIDLADKEFTAITVMYNDITFVFGLKDFHTDDPSIKYIKCKDEETLLKRFIKLWSSDLFQPDVVTGWNCLPIDTNVWKENEIVCLHDINQKEPLYDSVVQNVSPVSKKEKWDITLSNGYVMSSSGDHRWPLVVFDPEQYTKFSNRKSSIEKVVLETRNIDLKKSTYFMEMPIRENTNDNVLDYSDQELYLAGLIFTDGSIKDNYAFNFYQSDEDFMNTISAMVNRPYYLVKKEEGKFKDQFCCPILKSSLNSAISLIYKDNKKCLDINKLSKLSSKQFRLFLSGLMDGDGCFSRGKMSISNSTENLSILEQLMWWNGIFTCKSGTNISFDIDLEELFLLKTSRWNKPQTTPLERNNSQKAKSTKYKKIGDLWYVKIDKIENTKLLVDMMDIETDTHYFIANGIRTHNCELFDIPYIVRRVSLLLGEEEARKLSPFGVLTERVLEIFGKPHTVYIPLGVNVLDYLALYKKFTYVMRDSYKLDHIAEIELGEKKIDYSEYGSLNELYKQNHQLFIKYNIHDCTLIKKLDKKLQLLSLVYEFAYDSGTNFEDALRPVRTWDVIIHNHLMKEKIAVPQYKKAMISSGSPVGAHVKHAQVGAYDWIVSFDLESMYPKRIIGSNISPDTKITKKMLLGVIDE